MTDLAVQAPLLVITMGDPAGIGPEIILKALTGEPIPETRMVVAGSRPVLEKTARELKLNPSIENVTRETLSRVPCHRPGSLFILDACSYLNTCSCGEYRMVPGNVNETTGIIASSCIETGAKLCLDKAADALVTAPISKLALQMAGLSYTAHTELLSFLSQTPDVEMAFVSDTLAVVLATRHISLADVPGQLCQDRVISAVRAARHLGLLLGKGETVIGLCGLNPHAGEEGLMGNEESRLLLPALAKLRGEGISIEGPLPPDTAFIAAQGGRFGVIVALYHDQGLIPFKLLSFGSGAQITLGLPFVRTSVDHGVALDIAGQGLADPGSLLTAIRLASAIKTTSAIKLTSDGTRPHGPQNP